MRTYKYLVFLFLASILISACKSGYKFKLINAKKTTLGKTVSIKLEEVNGYKIDSIQFYINNKRISSEGNTASINTSNFGVGKHIISAVAFYPKKVKKINNTLEVFANIAPEVYSYKLLNTYPHDKKAYTQGLEFKEGILYETTGRHGQSWLRKVDYKTGKILQQENLDKKYFGEGMTIFNDKVFWLTWQSGKGFVYNLEDFKQSNEFKYINSVEGWGLTHNDTELIKSDGTNRIWFLDPETIKEKRNIQVYTNNMTINELNEIEFVDGKIYSNWWRTDGDVKSKSTIIIINPKTGVVEGLLGLNDLRNIILRDQKLDADEVLNGIAYNTKTKTFFVTGKHWGKLFEIELVKQ